MSETRVVDVGSSTTKVGDQSFKLHIGSIYGTPKHQNHFPFLWSPKSEYVGNEITKTLLHLLKINPIVEHGIIQNWTSFEVLMTQIYNNIFDPTKMEKTKNLMTEQRNCPDSQKEKKAQIMLETISVPSFLLANPTRLTQFTGGVDSGLFVDIGGTTTSFYGVLNCKPLENTVKKYNFGGNDSTKYLKEILTEKNIHLNNSSDIFIIEDMKKNFGYTAFEFNEEMEKSKMNKISQEFELPDLTRITLDSQRFRCNEVIFDPKLVCKEEKGVHELISDAVKMSNLKDCFISGGSSSSKGFKERIIKEMKNLGIEINIEVLKDPQFSAFEGGLIFSEIFNDDLWMTKSEYEEVGPNLIKKKSFL